MKRGSLITIALQGDYGKPRPALIIQSNFFDAHPSITILPITSELRRTPVFRIAVEPSAENGLRKSSEIMLDKITTISREKAGSAFGVLGSDEMLAVERGLAVFLGIAS